MRSSVIRWIVTAALLAPAGTAAQSFPTDDPVLRSIWEEGTERSQVETLTQTLNDSLGPRLTGSPNLKAASDWVIGMYTTWVSRRGPSSMARGWGGAGA